MPLMPTAHVISPAETSLVERQVLGADAASVTFSSLGSYEDLVLYWTARGTDGGNPNVNLRFNGDTGANYDRELLTGVGTTASSAADNAGTSITIVGALPGSGAGAGRAASGRIVIPGYRRTVFHKNVFSEFADLRGTVAADSLVGLVGGLWRNTAAITSITLLPSAGNFLAGSVFSLYGVAENVISVGNDGVDVQYESRSANTILGVADKGKAIDITAAFTQTFEADEILGDGWWVILRNATDDGTTVVVLDPAGTETIDGLTTVTMYSGETRMIMCNGAGGNFNSMLLSGGYALFTSDQNFVVPHGISSVTVDLVGGGGGGAGGRGAAAGGVRQGGSGGGGGARVQAVLAAGWLGNPGDTIAVDVATGGTLGGGGSSADGNNGGAGGSTVFGSLVSAHGGGGGLGGSSAATGRSGGGGGGSNEAGQLGQANANSRGGGNHTAGEAGTGGAGGGSNLSSAAVDNTSADWGGGSGGHEQASGNGSVGGGLSTWGASGGGSGGGLTSGNAESVGGAGGAVGLGWGETTIAGGTAGAVNGGGGGNGNPGTTRFSGTGGGGGGSQDSGTGGVGGDGGAPGGGGGGGGAGTTTGGDGGTGGRGECRVWYS